jgi:16S rRNA (cytosine1402-N4)-methyltransferase
MPHFPVLLSECAGAFDELKLRIFVDATVGAGGHALALLRSHPEMQKFIGLDQDKEALQIAKERLDPFKERVELVLANFSDLSDVLNKLDAPVVDGVLADLGVSSMQLDRPERGFSFMREGPLDMRMDRTQDLTAEEIVNTWGERDLAHLFFRYGEEKNARKIARVICLERVRKPISTTKALADLIERALPYQKRKIHPATQTFQALRIAVNRELDHIERFLPQALKSLRPGGRLAVITFHSLEDRIVKNQFAYFASDKESTSGIGGLFAPKEVQARIITRKPITPSQEEIENNPRSRSAKLRILEKR